jgi:hypothetical protein
MPQSSLRLRPVQVVRTINLSVFRCHSSGVAIIEVSRPSTRSLTIRDGRTERAHEHHAHPALVVTCLALGTGHDRLPPGRAVQYA